MKNIVENQGIKNDKPVPLSYEQLKQRLDAVVAECARVQAYAAETARDAEEMATADGGGGGYIEALNELLTPATSSALAEQQAIGADACVRALVTSDDDDFADAPNICAMVAFRLRNGEAKNV